MTASGAPPASNVAAAIKDNQGRVRYIIDLVEDEKDKPLTFADAKSEIDWQKAKSAQLIDDAINLRGVELLGTTSLVGTSFTAFLTEKQVEQFSRDNRVRRVTPDRYAQTSALWGSITDYSGQVRPWGLQAMGVSGGSSNGTATVYVLDTGVALHYDLNMSSSDQLVGESGLPLVGCYAHATHVAGIIGAKDNGYGVVGVAPGVRLVSITVAKDDPSTPLICDQRLLLSAFIQGLEMVKSRVFQSDKVGIVNLSFNGDQAFFNSTGTAGEKMRNVAQPAGGYVYNYKGALIVQSAGNEFADACGYAYNAPAANDGILVVGGFDDNGQPVKPFSSNVLVVRNNVGAVSPLGGYISDFDNGRGDGPGSNTGSCVEVYAPSQRIKSTWFGNGYRLLSGTSMAAPHVAGFAARLLESDGSIITSSQLETAVRAHFVTLNGSNLTMPHIANLVQTAQATVDIVEGFGGPISNIRVSSLDTINNFSKFPEEAKLRLQAVGAAYCYFDYTPQGGWPSQRWLWNNPTTYDLTAGVPPGQNYLWTVTCVSPEGVETKAVASGRIKQHVVAKWLVDTTSTPGQTSIANFGQVTWAFNGPFTQISLGVGAQYCDVWSYGFTGNPSLDPDFRPPLAFPPPNQTYQQTNLWDSLRDTGAHLANYYEFGTLNLADPHNSPYGLASFDGYKWRLTCSNNDETNTTVMYGTMQ